ncbi:hypothetical protein HDU99_004133, partial [Rhizoclosmatium hyalinum]
LGSFGSTSSTPDNTPNTFTGTFPTELCQITGLVNLNLKNVGLSGTIPDCFSGLTNLQFLSIGGNKLTGPITEAVFANASNLKMVSLASTASGTMGLTGPIPQSLASKASLTSLVLKDVKGLTGAVPSGFAGFGGKSAGATDASGPVSLCDWTGTGLCLPTGYSGPLCGLTISSTCKAATTTAVAPKTTTTTTTTTTAAAGTTVSKTKTTVTTTTTTTTAAKTTTAASTCAHDKCVSGVKLTSGCDACVTQIIAKDSYCGSTSWDSVCVGEVKSVCGITCGAMPRVEPL